MLPQKPDYLHEQSLQIIDNGCRDNLYREAQEVKKRRLLNGLAETLDTQLENIANEIQIRIRITQQEIFYIGELLVQAREILNDNNRNFQDWIDKNFDFGYHTALNFCNVYTACIGKLDLIKHVKPSILYKISSKQFPKELREILLFNNLLVDMKNNDLKEIYLEFQKEGFEAVKSKLENRAKLSLVTVHITPFVDNLKKVKYNIELAKEKLTRTPAYTSGYDGISGATSIGNEIASVILNSFEKCIEILKNAEKEVSNKYLETNKSQCPALIPQNVKSDPSQDTPIEILDTSLVIESSTIEEIEK